VDSLGVWSVIIITIEIRLRDLNLFIVSLNISSRRRKSSIPRERLRYVCRTEVVSSSRGPIFLALISREWPAIECIQRRLAPYYSRPRRSGCTPWRRWAVDFTLFLDCEGLSSRCVARLWWIIVVDPLADAIILVGAAVGNAAFVDFVD
jgi:hypothetical protein